MLFATALTASAAFGYSNEYVVRKLPGKTWTVGNGAVVTNQHWQYSFLNGSGPPQTCVGPVQWNGTKYVFPYGWHCGEVTVLWEYAPITAATGVDNPNSSEQHELQEYSY
ncbi:MAG: hypothetical protein ACM3VU_00065 [Arthrospira platensis]